MHGYVILKKKGFLRRLQEAPFQSSEFSKVGQAALPQDLWTDSAMTRLAPRIGSRHRALRLDMR